MGWACFEQVAVLFFRIRLKLPSFWAGAHCRLPVCWRSEEPHLLVDGPPLVKLTVVILGVRFSQFFPHKIVRALLPHIVKVHYFIGRLAFDLQNENGSD